LTNDPPTVGSDISLVVLLPAKTQTLELLGTVVYSIPRGPRLTYGYRVGVELKPFAQSDDGNSVESLDMLETLKRTYGSRKGK
jgi:Tfp pilus assembly protein PilZ